MCGFFFFKQKTAYEMRISDWSSDVCSSDLNDRRQLVGLEVIDGGGMIPLGAHLLPRGSTEPRGTAGWVTSSVMSPTLHKPLALALLADGPERRGETLVILHPGTTRRVGILHPRSSVPPATRTTGRYA